MKRIICLAFCSIFLLTGCSNKSYFETVEERDETIEEVADTDSSVDKVIYVQVAGAVIKPGVYELPEDARVYQAIEEAGGVIPQADDSSLNLAQPLTDGQKVYVYTKDEMAELISTEMARGDGLVDINKADVGELTSLPGIGNSKAELIIEYRQSNGPFSNIEDIKNVTGIGDGIYSKIQSKIKV